MTLTVSGIADLIAEKESGGQEESRELAKRVRKERRCGRCSKIGHNTRICTAEIIDADNSDDSE